MGRTARRTAGCTAWRTAWRTAESTEGRSIGAALVVIGRTRQSGGRIDCRKFLRAREMLWLLRPLLRPLLRSLLHRLVDRLLCPLLCPLQHPVSAYSSASSSLTFGSTSTSSTADRVASLSTSRISARVLRYPRHGVQRGAASVPSARPALYVKDRAVTERGARLAKQDVWGRSPCWAGTLAPKRTWARAEASVWDTQ